MERQKTKERLEVEKLVAEKKALIASTYWDIIKSALLILGGIIVFILIQRPESIINQKNSLETINRERAKLILDLFKSNNPQQIYQGLMVIKSTYPQGDSKWLDDIIHNYGEQSKVKDITDLSSKYIRLLQERTVAADELAAEANGTGGTRIRGFGAAFTMKVARLRSIDFEISQTQQQLIALGVISPADTLRSK